MLLKIFPDNPDRKKIHTAAEILRKGGIAVFPTDTVYAIGCSLAEQGAIEKLSKLKGVKPERANFSLICYDLSHISDFTAQFNTSTYKILKRALPGPYTFILKASARVARIYGSNKKTIGIRVPDNNIARELVRELGNPIVSTSVHDDDEIIDYTTDPEVIFEKFAGVAEVIIDGGYGDNQPSTVIDCTEEEPVVVREGKGDISII